MELTFTRLSNVNLKIEIDLQFKSVNKNEETQEIKNLDEMKPKTHTKPQVLNMRSHNLAFMENFYN